MEARELEALARAQVDEVSFLVAANDGGAIAGGTVNVNNSTFINNTATGQYIGPPPQGGSGAVYGGSGGAIVGGNIVVTNSLFSKNNAQGPPKYRIAREAELTVVIYKDQETVIANYVLDSLDLTADKGDEIMKSLRKVLP